MKSVENAVKKDAVEEDLFDVYFSLVEKSSESPFIYHRWTLISAIGALLGRQAYLDFAFDTIYPNMYICLMGNAGSRKSSAIKVAKDLVAGAGYNTFAREKTSSQKFIKDLGDGFDQVRTAPKKKKKTIDELKCDLEEIPLEDTEDDYDPDATSEVYITAGELEDFLGQNDGAFISLLTNLWDNHPHYSHGKMTSDDIWITNPTVNMIGGATPTTFNTVFPPEVIGQGMLSRLLLIYGGGARTKITLPPAPCPDTIAFFVQHLMQIKEQIKGKFTLTPEAYVVWDTIYQSDMDLGDNRLEGYINRRHIHYYKLCLIIAASELSMIITEAIAIKANTILHYAETLMPQALGEFGRSKNGDIAQVVLEVINKNAETGINIMDIFGLVSKEVDSLVDLSKIAKKLLESKRVEVRDQKLYPITITTKQEVPYVDFTLLREYTQPDTR
jgi:hypothetical protein